MLFEILSNSAPQLGRLIVYFIFLVYVQTEFAKMDIPFKKSLFSVPFILIAREILLIVFFTPTLFFLSDAVVLLILIRFVLAYIPQFQRQSAFIATVLLIAIILPLILYNVLPLTSLPLNFSLNILIQLANIMFILLVALYSYTVFRITSYNSQQSEFIIQYRSVIPIMIVLFIRIFFLFAPAALAGNSDDPFFQGFVTIIIHFVSLSIYINTIYSYSKFAYRGRITNDEFMENYVQTVFGFLQNIAQSMINRIRAKEVLDYAIQTTVSLTGADSGVVFLVNEKNELTLTSSTGYFPPPYELPTAASGVGTGIREFSKSTSRQTILARADSIQTFFENTPIQLGETIIGESALNNEAIYIRLCSEDERMKANSEDDVQFINSIIVIPIEVSDEVVGVIALAHRSREKYFSEDIFERTKIFVSFISLNLESLNAYIQLLEKQEIERDISIAAEIQQKLLPSRLPQNIEQVIAAWSRPLKGVSGDYYDIIPLKKEGKFAIVICDVAGKGVPASLIMVMIRTITHLIANSGMDTARIMRTINRSISERDDVERFATMSYLSFDPASRILEYTNAAHHPVLIFRKADKTLEAPDVGGLPIGLEGKAPYEAIQIKLEPEDAIMLYTDGIVEALNPEGEQFEDDRLKQAFVSCADKNAQDILETIQSELNDFVNGAEQHDDQTIIVMKA